MQPGPNNLWVRTADAQLAPIPSRGSDARVGMRRPTAGADFSDMSLYSLRSKLRLAAGADFLGDRRSRITAVTGRTQQGSPPGAENFFRASGSRLPIWFGCSPA